MGTSGWMVVCLLSGAGHAGFAIPPTVVAVTSAVDRGASTPIDLPVASDAVRVWVFFNDKAIHGDAERAEALRQVAESYDPRAIERRRLRRTRPGLFDDDDLPVAPAYVDAVRATGASIRIQSRWLNAVSIEAGAAQVRAVAALDCVRYIQPLARSADWRPVQSDPIPHDNDDNTIADFYGYASGQLNQINIPAAHNAGYTGAGIIIGVLDTGFQRSHEAFHTSGHEINVLGEYDWVSGDGNTQYEPGDYPGQYWHGTAILGEIASYKPDVMVGGAYDADFYLAKTEDISQEIPLEEDHYVAGLEWFEQNGVDVSTSSLGYIDWYTQNDLDGETAVTTIGVNVATANGVVCATAAGNSSHDFDPHTSHLIAPADAFDVLTCGAVDVYGETAGFSSDGPSADGRVKPEVLACGYVAYSINPDDDHGYTTASGTSLSTPLVACSAALVVQAHPDWSVKQVRSAILHSGAIFRATGTFDPYYIDGYGIIDVDYAIHTDFTGDVNRDGSIDVADHAALVDCMTGPGAPYADGCERADLDDDGDVDLADWSLIQNRFTGAW